ncbi:MAG: hypothetical protein ACLRZH_10685 [Ruthenibacterium lactatiformans]
MKSKTRRRVEKRGVFASQVLQKADKEKRFIITERALHLEPEISVTTDVWEFEQEARLADQPGTPAEERIRMRGER